MKKTYLTPGPSHLYPKIESFIEIAFKKDIGAISHRSKVFHEIFKKTIHNLKKIMDIPETHNIFFVGSSLESMEIIIQNVVEEKSTHIVTGAFSKKFFEIAKDLKKNAQEIEIDINNPNFNNLNIDKKTELICITENETSIGFKIPIDIILDIKKTCPNSLIALDCVSSAPLTNIDFKIIDIAFFSVQKAFGLPAGMGILIVNNKAIQKSQILEKKDVNIGSIHKFSELFSKANKHETPETPNVLNMFLLEQVSKDMLKKNILNIKENIQQRANLIYDFIKTKNTISAFIKNKKFQSHTTIVLKTEKQTKKIKNILKKKGIIVGSGYGKYKDEHIRIANFPAIKDSIIKKLIKKIDKKII